MTRTTMGAAPDSIATLPERLRALVARHLTMPAESIDPARPLGLYGLDSLTSMELVAAVEDEIGRPLPEWVLAEHPTLASLTAAITQPAPPSSDVFAADASLPSHFMLPAGAEVVDPPRTVLLTGATGFLGASLLRSLIDETPAHICCLVRAAPGEGLARVARNLDRYGLWQPAFADRLEIVRGDLAQPRFGLDDVAFEGLADVVDAIVHAGADVNWVASYAALRDVNVIGTREVIRLAMTARAKPIHFVSSISVCYVPGESRTLDESADPISAAHRLPLGYAQTKAVAESLLRQAAARGLPVRISRPGLIAGDTATGASNIDDLTARLVRGCIEMGQAPDLRWTFDAAPVDYVAQRILQGPSATAPGCQIRHIVQSHPRTWQECVLWMNLRGYACALVDYDTWRRRLADASLAPEHPLHGLRRFFLQHDAQGRSAAEHLQDDAHARVDSTASEQHAAAEASPCPPIDGALMGKYFDDYVARGFLPATSRHLTRREPTLPDVTRRYQACLSRFFDDPSLRVEQVEEDTRGSNHSIISELTSWRRGARSGLFRQHVTIAGASGPRRLLVVLKAKASDRDAIDVAETLAGMCDPLLGALVATHRESIGLVDGHRREPGLYAAADSELLEHLPTCFGAWSDDEAGEWGVLLEPLHLRARLDDGAAGAQWTPAGIDAAFDALIAIHAFGYRERARLTRAPWLRPARDLDTMIRMTPLWSALAHHAAPLVRTAGGDALAARHRALAEQAAAWWAVCQRAPETLIHHDFNPRNIALAQGDTGARAVVYDWELATWGAPQRDLMELLCFVLSNDASPQKIGELVEEYRRRLATATGVSFAEPEWRAGCHAALSHVLVERLGFYALIHRVRPQTFLPRVLRTWQQLDEGTA